MTQTPTCKVASGIWLRVAWSELRVLGSVDVTIGMNRCGDWCWRYWISPVADWERTWTAIISACIVERVAWSITWDRTDVGIVVTSVVEAVGKRYMSRVKFFMIHERPFFPRELWNSYFFFLWNVILLHRREPWEMLKWLFSLWDVTVNSQSSFKKNIQT